MPAPAARQAGPGNTDADAAQGSAWRRTSDAALPSGQAAWGQTAAAAPQASLGSGAWPAAPRTAAKAAWAQPAAPRMSFGSAALPIAPRGCRTADQQRPEQRTRRSPAGALTPAAAWDRLCQKSARPDESVWVAGGSPSSLEDSDWDVRSSERRVSVESSPEGSMVRRQSADCSSPLLRSTASKKRVASPLASHEPWSKRSRRAQHAAALLPAGPAQSQACHARQQPPTKLRRAQVQTMAGWTPGSVAVQRKC